MQIKTSKNGSSLSHLLFANDVLLFSQARLAQARLITNVLEKFCVVSGMKVSLDKSRIFAAKGVTAAWKTKITSITQIRFTSRLDKYLGFKLHHGRPRREDFEGTYERVASSLASWKSRLLNKPGRVTLTNVVLPAIPSYGMQVQ